MANDFAAVKETAFTSFHDRLARKTDSWARCVHVHTDDKPTLQLAEVYSAGLFAAAGTGDLSATDVDTANTSIVSAHYERKYRVRWQEYHDNPELVPQLAVMLANEGAATIKNLVKTGISGLFSLAHPLRGDRSMGAGKFYVDTGLAYGDGAGTQDNKLTAALSASAFDAAREILRGYYTQTGLELDAGDSVCLIAGKSNERLAHELARSPVTDANMQASLAADTIDDVVILPSLGDDWIMVDKDANPLILHLRKMPEILVSQTTDGVFIELVGMCTATFGVRTSEAGLVGSDAP